MSFTTTTVSLSNAYTRTLKIAEESILPVCTKSDYLISNFLSNMIDRMQANGKCIIKYYFTSKLRHVLDLTL